MRAFYGLLLLLLGAQGVCAQPGTTTVTDHPYYVVIGVFSVEKNAARFTRQAPKYQLTARYEMNFNRNTHYVYVLKTNNRTEAIDEALRLRSRPDSVFSDAWVYHGSFQKPEPGVVQVNQQVALPTSPGNEKAPMEKKPVKEPTRPFIFKITRQDSAVEIPGEIVVVDVDLAKKIGAYEGNKPVEVTKPKGKSGKITMTSHVPGYRRVQHELDYVNPKSDSIEMQDSTIIVSFSLTRLQKGDVTVSEVYFFKDAAVMRPESKYEVTSLLDMMKENEKYRIKIHGHTNGGGRGKIISMSDASQDYFSLTNTKEGFGSAKKLSKARAEMLKSYLVSNGIDAKRMEVKAWGGKKPLYDKLGSRAQSNVRVEIEILAN